MNTSHSRVPPHSELIVLWSYLISNLLPGRVPTLTGVASLSHQPIVANWLIPADTCLIAVTVSRFIPSSILCFSCATILMIYTCSQEGNNSRTLHGRISPTPSCSNPKMFSQSRPLHISFYHKPISSHLAQYAASPCTHCLEIIDERVWNICFYTQSCHCPLICVNPSSRRT